MSEKNEKILREVELQADIDREWQEKRMPRVTRDLATNLYVGPISVSNPAGGYVEF